MTAEQKLGAAIREADRHLDTLTGALRDWDAAPAADWSELESDRARVRIVDQILFRFTKLQDALGERLIPATLAVLGEPFEDKPMRDRLNRLEKLGYLDVDEWLSWRATRNRPAHEYPDAPELRFAAIQSAIQAARDLSDGYRGWRQRLTTEGYLSRHSGSRSWG